LGEFSLGKNYKLCSKVLIEELFKSGTTIKSYPLIAIIKPVEFSDKMPFKIVFSAPKRTFRKAFQRNRIKRICIEAVRLNKSILESYLIENQKQLALFLVYSSKDELNHTQLEKKVVKLFNEIIKSLNDVKQ
jgi:ribonuclease P protein component